MTTDWLADLGLTPVSKGIWRDEETGLEVEVIPEGSGTFAKVRGVANGMARANRRRTVSLFCNGLYSTEAADRFIDAIKLAARIAEAYNAQETSA